MGQAEEEILSLPRDKTGRKNVGTMKDMKKDEKIEREFRKYFDGNEAPPCDLTQAKRALAATERRAVRGRIVKIVSSFACVLLVAAVAVGLLLPRFMQDVPQSPSQEAPSDEGEAVLYSLASAQAQPATYAALEGEYGQFLSGFSRFDAARNASARYTLYEQNGEDVLLSVHVEYVRGLTRWRADVSFDLTEGAMLPEEFIPFGELSAEGSVNGYVYRYDDRSWNGEPVTDVCLTLSAGECYLTVMGQQREEALGVFLALLTEQA